MSLSDAAGYAPDEQRARMLIDRQLIDAGWIVQDKNSVNLYAALGVAVREVVMAPGHGRVDYLLYADQIALNLRAKAKGLAGTMPKTDQGAIASTRIPVPEKSTQITTVKLIAEVERAQRRCQALCQALLQAAFTGKLSGRSSDLDRVEEMATT